MKKTILTFLVSVLFLQCSPDSSEKKLLGKFDEFQKGLQSRLQKAVKSRGFAGAIDTCKSASPEMEKEMSTGLIVRRVSDKPRNPMHIPDAFEAEVLAQWKAQISEGKKPAVYSKKTSAGFRVMKPIMIGAPLCLKCHGGPSELDKDAQAKLAELYPDDKATGYKMGELRGAFSGIIP